MGWEFASFKVRHRNCKAASTVALHVSCNLVPDMSLGSRPNGLE